MYINFILTFIFVRKDAIICLVAHEKKKRKYVLLTKIVLKEFLIEGTY